MIRIKARHRGPLVVDLGECGALELCGTDGKAIDLGDRKRVLLCRCGGSSAAPFCDGTHNRLPFEAPPPVEPSEEEGELAIPAAAAEG